MAHLNIYQQIGVYFLVVAGIIAIGFGFVSLAYVIRDTLGIIAKRGWGSFLDPGLWMAVMLVLLLTGGVLYFI